ncbi:MAG TPA: hypothetical protein DF383_07275, partial [Deltaproteobacteria bacterium]|nr:hypothetical protein [Deltaproteobacteria bacterium]
MAFRAGSARARRSLSLPPQSLKALAENKMTTSHPINEKIIETAKSFSKHFIRIIHPQSKQGIFVLDKTAPSELKNLIQGVRGKFPAEDDIRRGIVREALVALADPQA